MRPDMSNKILCQVFLLVYLFTRCLSTPVPKIATLYDYKGHIDTRVSALSGFLARWIIEGKLSTVQRPESDLVFVQLYDVKTSVFNGKADYIHNAERKEIPKEVKIIEQHFAIKLNSFDLLFQSNEPLWSINMKTGIADFLKHQYQAPGVLSDVGIDEMSLFGNCRVIHTKETKGNEVIYKKKLENFNCTREALRFESNREPAPIPKDPPSALEFNYNSEFRQKSENGVMKRSLHGTANIAYKTSPSAPYTLHIDQQQQLIYIGEHESEEIMNATRFVIKKGLRYQFSDDRFSGRHKFEIDPNKYLKHYNLFKQAFTYTPVNEYTKKIQHFDMYEALETINVEGLRMIQANLTDNDIDAIPFFLSLLSYVGTRESIKYLTEFYKTVKSNVGLSTWNLVTFPQYMKRPTKELLEELEPLISNSESEYKMVKNAAVFGFAAAVGRTCRSKDTFWHKYVDLYRDKYFGGQNYEDRMVYLLGLVNMVHCIDDDLIHGILTNSSESTELRLLAFNGFKKYLQQRSYENKIYDTYWPIVQRKSQPFPIRVAALGLLLSVNLTKEQFNSILMEYRDDPNEPEDLQLANYVITTLHSLQNTTGYFDHIGVMAAEAVKTINIRPYPKNWASGFYRLSYTDSIPNVGAAFEALLITDPRTNIINTIQLSFNNFGNWYNYGTYTLYLKFDGVSEHEYFKKLLTKDGISSIPQLLELLKKNDFRIETYEEDIHVDVVLFFDNIAVYANHMSEFGNDQLQELKNDFKELLFAPKYISFPLKNFIHLPSIFGTPIWITNYKVNVEKHNMDANIFQYRSSNNIQTGLHAYNPLIDVKITAYKYNIDEMNVRLNITHEKRIGRPPAFLTWANEKNVVTYNWVNNLGVTVGERKILHEYCDKCRTLNEVPIDKYENWTYNLHPIGLEFPIQMHKHPNISSNDKLYNEFVSNNLHRYNADALPFVGPILFAADFFSYKLWLQSDLTSGFIQSRPFRKPFNKMKPTMTELNFLVGNRRDKLRHSNLVELKIDSTVKSFEDEIYSEVNLSATHFWDSNHPNGNKTTTRGTRMVDFRMIYNSPYDGFSFKICGHGDIRFPSLRGDRYSLEPYEPTTGEIRFEYAKNVDDKNCVPVYSIVLKEKFSSKDKNDKLQEESLRMVHEKCLSDSKYLKFTAPTRECKRAADWLTEYDTYKIYMEMIKHLEGQNLTITQPSPAVFQYSRIDENKLLMNIDLSVLQSDYHGNMNKYTSEVYYPHMTVNPLWLSYDEDEAAYPPLARSICTVTPSSVQTFSGEYVSNQQKEWLAFGECYNVSRRGLNGYTIDDKYVGFTFYTNGNVVEVSIKKKKPRVNLNGKTITEFHHAEDLRISFWDDQVVFIKDDKVELYYNTEYVYIKVDSLYTQALCGICS